MRRSGARSPPAAGHPPVATEQRLLAAEEDRGRHHGASVHRELHHQGFRQRARYRAEERARQIRLVPVTHESVAVQVIDTVEERLVELAAEAGLEAHARVRDAAALAPRLLALLGGEGAPGVIEARVTAIAPVKLAVAAPQPAALCAGRTRRLIEKQRMPPRQSVARGGRF